MNDEGGERVAKEIVARGGAAVHQHCDVSELAQVEAAVARACKEFGGLDVMFNNAAWSGGGYVHTIDPAIWDQSLRVMLSAVFYGIRAAVPAMLERGGGSIVNTASVEGLFGEILASPYATAKAGVINLTRNAAIEYGRVGHPRELDLARRGRDADDGADAARRAAHARGARRDARARPAAAARRRSRIWCCSWRPTSRPRSPARIW